MSSKGSIIYQKFQNSLEFLNRKNIEKFLQVGVTFCIAYIFWIFLSTILNCDIPVVVVLSESMAPSFTRGDILILKGKSKELKVNDIAVFKLDIHDIPIVHRIHYSDISSEGKENVITKGDNNQWHDYNLYGGKNYITRGDIIGEVCGYIPMVGYLTIVMSDYPIFKWGLIGITTIMSLM